MPIDDIAIVVAVIVVMVMVIVAIEHMREKREGERTQNQIAKWKSKTDMREAEEKKKTQQTKK